MKRNLKPFSVEIKKSRAQGQRDYLPPRHLFATSQVEATKVFHKDEPRVVPEPSAALRILPSIVEPVWSRSEPVEPVPRKRPSVEANRRQMELDLTAAASEDMKDAHAGAPASAKTVHQADNAPVDAEEVLPVHAVQPAQRNGVKAKPRKARKKTSGTAGQEIVSEPIPETAMTASVVSSKAVQRRITKRLAAAAQLPRHERWKGRLHPTAW